MNDDDGMMVNWSSSQPNKASPAAVPATSVEKKETSDKKQSNGAAKDAVENTSASAKIRHGKAQVLSSLFSSNPEIKPAPRSWKKTSRSDIPSNAPVADSTQFTGIGIDPDLVDLLQSKLNVSAPTNVQRKAIPILLGPSRTVQACEIPDKDVDVVVQAETGSGKTLTYLLPIVNRLVGASTATSEMDGFGDRTVGTVAIILTPTRELAQQVASVLTTLVNLGRPKSTEVRRTHWIVPGIVIGGDKKSKEKARLRKGVNVLVSTPGRLLDHLENTKSFCTRHLRWLVLDEADRLLDLGFEETLKKIMALLDERTREGPATQFVQSLQSKYWPQQRQTVLCSATLRDDVKDLVGSALINPIFVSGTEQDATNHGTEDAMEEVKFTTPNQLKQTYTITPAKLRLVTLTAMLKTSLVDTHRRAAKSKVIVFFSCCDSVDFHYDLFGNAEKQAEDTDDEDEDDNDDETKSSPEAKALNKIFGKTKDKRDQRTKVAKKEEQKLPHSYTSTILGQVPVFRLHGDLDQQTRTLTFTEFSKAATGVLLCTDVAARGLDLPNVDRIIQYDPPTDMKDYVHRVGRTARLGKAGEAALFLLPSEMDYLTILKGQDLSTDAVTVETVLGKLVTRAQGDYQTAAQEIQNKLENYVLSEEKHVLLARKAYWSSVRAYATHASAEKHIFHVKKLHLGHLAKAFGLREAPSNLHEPSQTKKKKTTRHDRQPGRNKAKTNPFKRTMSQASEFAIISSTDAKVAGPTIRKRRKQA